MQRLEQDSVDQTKDCSVGPNPQSQRAYDDDRECRVAQQTSDGVANILCEIAHVFTSQDEVQQQNDHSYRSATNGLTRVARRAGM
jgi:hypothetical protein